MKHSISLLWVCGLGMLACFRAGAQSYADDVNVADGFPQIGYSQSGDNEMGDWTSNQGRGIVDNSPFGSVANPRVGFAAWDYFAEGAFSGSARQYYGKGANLQATLAQHEEGAMWSGTINPANGSLLDNGLGGRLSSSDLDFSVSASLNQSVQSVVLQLKHTPLFGEEVEIPFIDAQLMVGGQAITYDYVFAPYVDSDAPRLPPSESGTTVIFYVTEFHWTGVDIQAFESFSINFSQLSSYFSIDTVAVYTLSSVPEPATYALLVSGMVFAGVVLLRRRLRSGRRA